MSDTNWHDSMSVLRFLLWAHKNAWGRAQDLLHLRGIRPLNRVLREWYHSHTHTRTHTPSLMHTHTEKHTHTHTHTHLSPKNKNLKQNKQKQSHPYPWKKVMKLSQLHTIMQHNKINKYRERKWKKENGTMQASKRNASVWQYFKSPLFKMQNCWTHA